MRWTRAILLITVGLGCSDDPVVPPNGSSTEFLPFATLVTDGLGQAKFEEGLHLVQTPEEALAFVSAVGTGEALRAKAHII